MKEFYKTLTPKFRVEIQDSINEQLTDLNTCESNAFVNVQKIGLEMCKNLFNALPDGYPIPMKRK